MNTDRFPWIKRLAACLFGGLVLALMVGNQEGTINADFGIAFREAMWHPAGRMFIFMGIGVIGYLLITGWRYAVPYVKRPGVKPLGIGLLTVIVAQTVMNWYDPIAPPGGNARFSELRTAVQKTTAIASLTRWFFVDYLAWMILLVALVVIAAAIVTRQRPVGYLGALISLAGAVTVYYVHHDVDTVGGGQDHALGSYTAAVGYLVLAGAALATAFARSDVADTRQFADRVLNWRPGLPMVVLAAIFGLTAFLNDCWYGPVTSHRNDDFADTATLFKNHGLSPLATAYLNWLGWTVFIAAIVLTAVACYYFHRALAALAIVVSLAGIVVTFFTLKAITFLGFQLEPADGQRWGNLGVGGFVTCVVLALCGAAAVQVVFGGSEKALVAQEAKAAKEAATTATGRRDAVKALPVTAMVLKIRRSARTKSLVVVALALALFLPPMLTVTWQNVLVTQIGAYVFLAVGLNVVVGWAGLLDLGYIAFYGIGSYTTAYVTGSLPVKPPSFLHVTPLLAIPFAIVACLIAGVLLGAPTLRLRGDYLAIVTLGFGEIITEIATNNPGGLTGGPIGPTVPHPRLSIGSWHITWGEDNLPYWYLLVVLLVIVLILFYRLEGSRLGRAWAAVREDEVAAQASGVNTMRVKLLAFAIGASTSGLAGVFFATQIGYFDPTLFTLQESILIVAYVVFGGMGSLPGAMLGAAVLTWVPQFLKSQVPADDRQMWVGAMVLLMMIFRPAGLLPAKRRKAELEGLDLPMSSEVSAVPAGEGL
jgi:ABC-type branched-subunit amino acid transport system permease subunit